VHRFSIPAGRLLGIPIRLHISWLLALAGVIGAAAQAFGVALPELPASERALMGVATGVTFFGCLVLHELAHALVARRIGIRVRGITLFLFGGVASIDGEPTVPGQEFAMALAGPAVSLFLGAAAGVVAWIIDTAGSTGPSAVLATLAAVNLAVALFNLLPGLPLDGGRLLRSTTWRLTGDYLLATRLAVIVGVAVGAGLGAVGAALAITGRLIGLWYLVLGAFLGSLARRSGRAASRQAGALAWSIDEGQAAEPGS
jgi:Zn-dependent protease